MVPRGGAWCMIPTWVETCVVLAEMGRMGWPWGLRTDMWSDWHVGHGPSVASLQEWYQAERREDGKSNSDCIWGVSNWQKVKGMSDPTLTAVDGCRGHGGTSRCGDMCDPGREGPDGRAVGTAY